MATKIKIHEYNWRNEPQVVAEIGPAEQGRLIELLCEWIDENTEYWAEIVDDQED